jgi:hypothetical protein
MNDETYYLSTVRENLKHLIENALSDRKKIFTDDSFMIFVNESL